MKIQVKSPIVATINNSTIRQEDLWTALMECSGQEILDDLILTTALENELATNGFEVSQTDLRYEEDILLSLSSRTNEDSINKILQDRGIGPERKSQLLWRNAALRKLTSEIDVGDEAVKRMYSIVHGPKYPARIIVLTTLGEANETIVRLQDGETFSNVALEVSIDPSASLGGLVNPISTSDPAWPSTIREAISTAKVNEFSEPIFIGDRWVLLTVTGAPSTPTAVFEDVENEMRRLTTLAQERFQMEKIAQKVIEKVNVRIFDQHLMNPSGSNR